jgi:hypothetical protein
MNPVYSGSVSATTSRVPGTIGRIPETIGQVPATVGRMSEKIAVEYHTCLTSYRVEPDTLDISHGLSGHVGWSEI